MFYQQSCSIFDIELCIFFFILCKSRKFNQLILSVFNNNTSIFIFTFLKRQIWYRIKCTILQRASLCGQHNLRYISFRLLSWGPRCPQSVPRWGTFSVSLVFSLRTCPWLDHIDLRQWHHLQNAQPLHSYRKPCHYSSDKTLAPDRQSNIGIIVTHQSHRKPECVLG